MTSLRPLLLAVFLGPLASSATASAAPSTRLVYARGPGAESCPDEAALRRAVAVRIGYDPFFPWASLTVTVEVTREGAHRRARVLVVDEGGLERGSQSLQSSSATCDDLLESTALAVAIALDAAPKAPPPSESAPDPTPEAAPPAATPSPVIQPVSLAPVPAKDAIRPGRPAPQPALPGALSLWLAPGARVSAGAWNAASVGPDLLVELRRGRLGLGAEGRYDVATVGVGTGAQASVQRATGSVLPCAHFAWLVVCGIATFGELWARGDVVAPTTQSDAYVALGGRIGADVAILPKLHLLGSIDVVGVATGTVIEVDGGRSAAASKSAEASGGIALLLPIL